MVNRGIPAVPNRLLRTILRFQRNYPLVIEGKRVLGGVRLEKKAELARLHYRILVKDPQIASYFCEPIDHKELSEKIVGYTLKKCKGNKRKAILALHRMERSVDKARLFFGDRKAVLEIAKSKNVPPDELRHFVKNTMHFLGEAMYASMVFANCRLLLSEQ